MTINATTRLLQVLEQRRKADMERLAAELQTRRTAARPTPANDPSARFRAWITKESNR